MMDLLLAVDGGNSKTDAVVFTPDGTLVAVVRGPGSGGGPEHASGVVERLLGDAGVSTPDIRVCVAALAGVDFERDAERFASALNGVLGPARVTVVGDARALLEAEPGDGTEVRAVLVSGAGLNAVARGPAGIVSVPALGWISGDEGGGDHLARCAVSAAYRARDGRGPATVLERAVLEETGAADHEELALMIRDGLPGAEAVYRLPAVVARAASAGDAVAGRLMADASSSAIALLKSVVRRAGASDMEAPAVSVLLAGGMFADPGFAGSVERAIAAAGWRSERLRCPPVLGAVRLACRLGVGEVTEADRLADRIADRLSAQTAPGMPGTEQKAGSR